MITMTKQIEDKDKALRRRLWHTNRLDWLLEEVVYWRENALLITGERVVIFDVEQDECRVPLG